MRNLITQNSTQYIILVIMYFNMKNIVEITGIGEQIYYNGYFLDDLLRPSF
jgi:hypothetical protein